VKAIRIHEDGGPEVLRYEDVPDPEPKPDEVLVELRAAALNHLDVWVRKGMPSVPKPRILGADGAGIRVDTGERVVINPGLDHGGGRISVVGEHMDGTCAELIAVPEENVYAIPDGLSFEDAAAFPLVFETAYRMLVTKARLQEGEWVLIWGIGSGVSTAALAIAKALGARAVVTSSSDAKLARARELGADETLNHATEDVAARVKELTGGGADVVVEHVGEATWKHTLNAARQEGRIVVCGATSGPNPPAGLHRIWWKQLAILGSTMGTKADFEGAYDLIASAAVETPEPMPQISTVSPASRRAFVTSMR
jgi:NADPH:quinone reductase-like Zn-dependent oxidoreductase